MTNISKSPENSKHWIDKSHMHYLLPRLGTQ